MRLMISKEKLVKSILLIWWIIIFFDGFYIVDVGFVPSNFIPLILHGYKKEFNLLCITFVYIILFINDIMNIAKEALFKNYITIFTILFIFCIIFTPIFYPEADGYDSILYYSLIYLNIFFYYVLLDFIKEISRDKRWTNWILISAILLSVLLIVAATICNSTGEIILPHSEMLPFHVRNGLVRYTSGSEAILLGYVISLISLFHPRTPRMMKCCAFLVAVTALIECIYVAQTRALIAIYICTFLITFVIHLSMKRLTSICLIVLMMIGGLLFAAGETSNIINTQLMIDTSEISYINRFAAIGYYIKCTLSNPFIGIGRVSDITAAGKLLRHGTGGLFYPDDVGLIGNMATFGIGILLWYVGLICKIINNTDQKAIKTIFICIFVGSAFTLSILDEKRIILLPILLALYDNIRKRKLNK